MWRGIWNRFPPSYGFAKAKITWCQSPMELMCSQPLRGTWDPKTRGSKGGNNMMTRFPKVTSFGPIAVTFSGLKTWPPFWGIKRSLWRPFLLWHYITQALKVYHLTFYQISINQSGQSTRIPGILGAISLLDLTKPPFGMTLAEASEGNPTPMVPFKGKMSEFQANNNHNNEPVPATTWR